MLSLTPIVERLRAAGLRNVEGVLELVDVQDTPRALPAHYVVPTRESAGESRMAGVVDQLVDVGFSVMIAADGSRRNKAGISEELKTATDAVKLAIVGWTHPDASRACELAGGGLASAAGRACTWEVRFRARYHFRKTS